jgi:hypothetical protein
MAAAPINGVEPWLRGVDWNHRPLGYEFHRCSLLFRFDAFWSGFYALAGHDLCWCFLLFSACMGRNLGRTTISAKKPALP